MVREVGDCCTRQASYAEAFEPLYAAPKPLAGQKAHSETSMLPDLQTHKTQGTWVQVQTLPLPATAEPIFGLSATL